MVSHQSVGSLARSRWRLVARVLGLPHITANQKPHHRHVPTEFSGVPAYQVAADLRTDEGSVVATAANVHDATILPDLLHGEETRVWGDSAYRGQDAVIQAQAPKARDLPNHHYRYKGVVNEVERAKNLVKSQIRSRVEHVFGVIKGAFPFASGPLPGSRKERPPALCHLRAGQSVPCAPTAVATLKGVIRPEIGFQAIKGLPNKEIKPHRGATVHLGGPPWQNPVSASCACRNGG